jgi:hypothetical protein
MGFERKMEIEVKIEISSKISVIYYLIVLLLAPSISVSALSSAILNMDDIVRLLYKCCAARARRWSPLMPHTVLDHCERGAQGMERNEEVSITEQ